MKLEYSKMFLRMYKRLSPDHRGKVDKAILLFEQNPFSPSLYNHKPKGELQGTHSISAGYDLRILYREEGEHAIVFLLKVGTHDQVYRG